MKSIGFPPGANNFRLIMIVIMVVAMMAVLLSYTDQISIETEKASIQQTKNIINSTLVVVFANHAVKGQLDRLNEFDGGNPFVQLAKYNLTPNNYRGEIRVENPVELAPGWYYDKLSKRVIYKTYYDDQVYYFAQILDYRDADESGSFEANIDEYHGLIFR